MGKVDRTTYDEVVSDLENLDEAREQVQRHAREVIRASKGVIGALHRGEPEAPPLREMRRCVRPLLATRDHFPELFYGGTVEQALQEFAEAELLMALLHGDPLPTRQQLDITSSAWLLGLGDVPGELRRSMHEALRAGDYPTADSAFQLLEDVTELLLMVEFPSGLLPMRHKQDVARSLVERSRSDLLTAQRGRQLHEELVRRGAVELADEFARQSARELDGRSPALSGSRVPRQRSREVGVRQPRGGSSQRRGARAPAPRPRGTSPSAGRSGRGGRPVAAAHAPATSSPPAVHAPAQRPRRTPRPPPPTMAHPPRPAAATPPRNRPPQLTPTQRRRARRLRARQQMAPPSHPAPAKPPIPSSLPNRASARPRRRSRGGRQQK